MATGYTECIANDVSFKEFATKCIRAFGVCIDMRDDELDTPIPDKLEENNYHLEALENAKRCLANLLAMTLKKKKKIFEEYKESLISDAKEAMKEKKELLKKYQKMLKKVEAFNPPSPDHVQYKSFMIDQINKSIDFDCDIKYYQESINKSKKLKFKDWNDDTIRSYEHDIEYHANKHCKEKAGIADRNLWIKQAREAIAEIKD